MKRFPVLAFLLLLACRQEGDIPEIYTRPNPASEFKSPNNPYDSATVHLETVAKQEREKLLSQLTPTQIRDVYHDFRALRGENITRSKLDRFLHSHHITEPQLKAVLEEGDHLGWSEPAE